MQRDRCSRPADFDAAIVPVYFTLMNEARRYYRDERARDLAAEAVTRALEHRGSYDGRPLLAWCRAIMRNLWINTEGRLESRNTVPIGERDVAGGEAADMLTIVGGAVSVVQSMCTASVAVSTLVEYARGYSLAEIAARRGVPLGTVKRRVHDGRVMLAKALLG